MNQHKSCKIKTKHSLKTNFFSLPKFVVALILGFVFEDADPHDFNALRVVPLNELLKISMVSRNWLNHIVKSLLVIKTRRIAVQPLHNFKSAFVDKINLLTDGKAIVLAENFYQLPDFNVKRLQTRGTQIGIFAPKCSGKTTLTLALRRMIMCKGQSTVRFGWLGDLQTDETMGPENYESEFFNDSIAFDFAHIEMYSSVAWKTVAMTTPKLRTQLATCFIETCYFNRWHFNRYLDYIFVSDWYNCQSTPFAYANFLSKRSYQWLVIQPSTNLMWKFCNYYKTADKKS